MKNLLKINLFLFTYSSKKLKFVFILLFLLPLTGCKSVVKETVNCSDTNLIELCREHIAHGWKSYVKINRKEFNSKGYFVSVVGEDGCCEHGKGPTQKDTFNSCKKWKNHHNIIGTCELYARG